MLQCKVSLYYLDHEICIPVILRRALQRGFLGTFAAEKIIGRIQSKIRYGFPLINIPPLAPLKLGDRNNTINLSFLR